MGIAILHAPLHYLSGHRSLAVTHLSGLPDTERTHILGVQWVYLHHVRLHGRSKLTRQPRARRLIVSLHLLHKALPKLLWWPLHKLDLALVE